MKLELIPKSAWLIAAVIMAVTLYNTFTGRAEQPAIETVVTFVQGLLLASGVIVFITVKSVTDNLEANKKSAEEISDN
jgi:hypothetical protein